MTAKNPIKRAFFIPEIVAAEDRLPVSGMTKAQLLGAARFWWDNVGRDMQREARDRKRDGIKNDEELKHESGILFGKPWDELNRREQFDVAKAYHREWCRVNCWEVP